LPTFTIKENANGRFHIHGFGAHVGGADGLTHFTLVVLDNGNRMLGDLHTVLTEELGISASAVDYRTNAYRKIDFFVRNTQGQLGGKS
jgi:hypothetical protein